MKAIELCPNCGAKHYIDVKERIRFAHDGYIFDVVATRFNDAFYEIIEGEFTGNLVHIFDAIK